jgi:hypothetical protein
MPSSEDKSTADSDIILMRKKDQQGCMAIPTAVCEKWGRVEWRKAVNARGA